ncbi:MAG: DUF2029 domain-containing protein [Chitinophagales bacterium]|nr:DUF2029 domain-containing protein [Chitinophagales bacterium]
MLKKSFLYLLRNFPELIVSLIILPYLVIKAINGGNFNTYLAAAELLRHGDNCYNVWLSYGNSNVPTQYGYSPLFATLLIPFTYLASWLPPLLFLLADVVMLFRIFRLIARLLKIDLLPNKLLWLGLVLVFSLRFILHNFEMVQLNILLLWLTFEGLYRIFFGNNKWIGASLLSAGINFKILPIVFIPYILYRRELKASTMVAVFSIFFLWLPSVFFGFNFNLQLHEDWLTIINPLNTQYNADQNSESCRLHGLAALIAAYFTNNNNTDFQWPTFPLREPIIEVIINISRLILILITFFFLQSKPFLRFKSPHHFVTETAYIFLITTLIFPQQNKWAFVYIIPALAIIFHSLLKNTNRKSLWSIFPLSVVFILTTLTTDGIIGKNWNNITECMKLVTIGIILIIPILMQKIEKEPA